ncbi:hypothetical protein AKJ09_00972 [Labilithrix luteola]|uniref:Uncharacterized protein n=1 Tax=Labilithrix luteola TaxID=1391654 RepID=A0A0K1PLA2_9BACT|nr:hypothetical protein [Labilithrix luteola]AKU94308.1 hypothetical protein AKJ09_00972 [Labilithrix luteola]
MNDDATNDRRVLLRRALVKAGREERVSSELRSRLLATAAVSAATTVSTSSAAEVARPSDSLAPPPSSRSSTAIRVSGTAPAWKTAGVLFAIGAVAVSAMTVTRTESTPLTPPQATATPVPEAPADAPPAAAPSAEVPAEVTTLTVDQLRSVSSGAPSIKKVDAAKVAAPALDEQTTARPASTARLTEEMQRLAEIRSAANGARPGEALRRLEEYRTDFPNGMHAEEAEVLRIESLSRLGRTSAAAALARKFLNERPNSPYVGRIRATLATLPNSDD